MMINLLVEGGAMKPGPNLSQKIGPLGLNLGKIIQDINIATKDFVGMKVPVELDVDIKTKTYKINVKSPPVSELIKKEIGAEKGSGDHKNIFAGNLAIEQIIKVAKVKISGLLTEDFKSAVKTVVGTCISLGVLIENKPAKEVLKEIEEGKYDNLIKNQVSEVSIEKKKLLSEYFSKIKQKQDEYLKKKEEETAKQKESAAAASSAPQASTPTTTEKKTGKKK